MADERLFSRAEAEALLPRLRPLLEGIREAGDRMAAASRERGGNGGGGVAREVMALGDELRAALLEVEELGIVLRDTSTGLVDFPALRDGAPVYLCWRLGEEGVGWWHPRDTGFAGRSEIDWEA
ncbi:MAG TPA: DUF2203 domain-containing protein [Candidatus Dormibacteraeota bacterium]|nr:DUF2203 domain-containing protein [Candidatus Dormibacteraeota bacterium]